MGLLCSLEVGRQAEPGEDLGRFGERRRGFVVAPVGVEELGVFEQHLCEDEGRVDLAQLAGGLPPPRMGAGDRGERRRTTGQDLRHARDLRERVDRRRRRE